MGTFLGTRLSSSLKQIDWFFTTSCRRSVSPSGSCRGLRRSSSGSGSLLLLLLLFLFLLYVFWNSLVVVMSIISGCVSRLGNVNVQISHSKDIQ